MAAGMILAGISGREHGSGSKRSFPIRKRADASATSVNGVCTKPYRVWDSLIGLNERTVTNHRKQQPLTRLWWLRASRLPPDCKE